MAVWACAPIVASISLSCPYNDLHRGRRMKLSLSLIGVLSRDRCAKDRLIPRSLEIVVAQKGRWASVFWKSDPITRGPVKVLFCLAAGARDVDGRPLFRRVLTERSSGPAIYAKLISLAFLTFVKVNSGSESRPTHTVTFTYRGHVSIRSANVCLDSRGWIWVTSTDIAETWRVTTIAASRCD